MPDTPIPKDRLLDPVGLMHGARLSRDPERTPMHWTGGPGAGFTRPGVEPWLPFGDFASCNVADQQRDPDSMLSLTRDLIGLRDAIPDLRSGTYATDPRTSGGLWVWKRGERLLVAVNLSPEPADVPDVDALVRISTIRARDTEQVKGAWRLEPWEAAIAWLS
jgi:alpha-glucosidase